jgi:hypothetical protein
MAVQKRTFLAFERGLIPLQHPSLDSILVLANEQIGFAAGLRSYQTAKPMLDYFAIR